jgi:hypothetical protein
LLKKATPLTCEIEKVIDTCIYWFANYDYVVMLGWFVVCT